MDVIQTLGTGCDSEPLILISENEEYSFGWHIQQSDAEYSACLIDLEISLDWAP